MQYVLLILAAFVCGMITAAALAIEIKWAEPDPNEDPLREDD